MALTAGTLLGPYRIESLIGSGGMGEVYKATDTRLNRVVAIKQLQKGHDSRFEQEARAIAAINHPNICQIYDIGGDYLVLEFLNGETLRGPLSPDEAVRLAVQVADALESAHARGILHRDLKPANIMVVRRNPTDPPSAKLLDFGVARQLDAGPDATRTFAGIIGTPAYMSPEQIEGQHLDLRSDIFAFGAVLYEMLAGRRAFEGNSAAKVLTAVMRDEPRPLEAPPALARVVTRCLAKDREARFATIREVKAALQTVTLTQEDVQSSIAVLPFANLSADKDNEYFSDGLAEEIISALAQVPRLRVIARTSAFSFKGRNEDVRQIAQALGVTNVLEGSVRRAGDRVRVTAQLVAAQDGSQLWSSRFDRPMTDVFEVQDEIAEAIASALKGRLVPAETIQRQYTPSVHAFEAFLKGRAHIVRFTPDSFNRAKAYFEQAMALDAKYPDPHAELALAYFISGMHGMRPMREVAPFVRAEVQQALALNPEDARPRVVLGAVALAHDYDWAAAEEHFGASMDLPNVSAEARWIYASLYLGAMGRFAESSNEMARAVDQDPLNATWHAILAAHLIHAEQFERAVAVAAKATELAPDYFVSQQLLGEAYLASGRIADALTALEFAYTLAKWNAMAVGLYAGTLWQTGDTARAARLMADLGDSPVPLWGHVRYHLQTNDLDAAAEWYEKMIDSRDPFALVYSSAPMTRPLWSHPRWEQLAALMKLPKGHPSRQIN